MNKHINTENILKEKFDSREFAFDESAWAEAEAMIAAQDAGGGKKKIFWIFSIALLLGLITAGIWFGTSRPSNNTQLAETQSGTTADELSQSNSLASEGSNAALANAETMQSNNETASTPTTAENNELVVANALKSPGIAAEKPAKTGKKPVISGAAKVLAGTNNSANNSSNNIVENITETGDVTTNKQIADNDIENKTTNGRKKENLNEAVSDKSDKELVSNENETPKNEEMNTSDVGDLAENNSLGADDEGEKSELELAAVDSSANEHDEIITPSNNRKPKPQPPGFNTKNSFSIIGGLGIWDAYSSTLGKPSTNGILGPVIGVGYEAAFNKQFAIGVNLLYMSRGALNYRRVFNNDISYDFGYQKTSTIIEATNLHFANVPLYARYSFTNKHHVIGGLSYSYLIGTYYTEKKVVETSLETSDEGTKKKFTQHPGFNKWDIISFIGYETNLSDKLKLSAQFHFGFNDMTNDDFETDGEFNDSKLVAEEFDRNIGVQLMLRYDLFKH